jgi:hypothetical protein
MILKRSPILACIVTAVVVHGTLYEEAVLQELLPGRSYTDNEKTI